MLERFRRPWSDRRAEVILGALACTVLAVIVFMIVFVAIRAWPSFHANGLSWFSAKGDVDQQLNAMVNSGANPSPADYQLGAWPLIYATLLTTALATVVGLVVRGPLGDLHRRVRAEWIRRLIVPIVRLLAAVPSVVYGLIGILVLAPFVGNHLVSPGRKESVQFVIQLSGTSLLVAVVILTVMITPIMVAITVDGLYAIPRAWKEGAVALGVNRWRAMWTVTVRAARPRSSPAPCSPPRGARRGDHDLDGLRLEGLRPEPARRPHVHLRAAAHARRHDRRGLRVDQRARDAGEPLRDGAAAARGAFFLSIGSWIAKQPLKKYGTRI